MRYIVDGCNLLNRVGLLESDSEGFEKERKLLKFLSKDYMRKKPKTKISVVYDSRIKVYGNKSDRGSSYREIFAQGEADPIVVKKAKEAKTSGVVTVVTSDREICGSVSSAGCRTISSEVFWDILNRGRKDIKNSGADKRITGWYRNMLKEKGHEL